MPAHILNETTEREQIGPRTYRVTTSVGPRFYHDGQAWQNIDSVPVVNAGVFEMIRNRFIVRHKLSDASWEWSYRGKTLGGKLIGLAWLNMATKARQIAAVAKTVTPVQDGNTITWPAYFGAGLDLQLRHYGHGVKQAIIATPAGRQLLGAPPYGADSGIVIVEELTLPAGVNVEGWDGVIPLETLGGLRIRSGLDKVADFTIDKAFNLLIPSARVDLTKRLFVESGTIHLLSGVNVSILRSVLGDANTWIFDPTISIDADNRDGHFNDNYGGGWTETLHDDYYGGTLEVRKYGNVLEPAFEFQITAPQGATIDTCTMTIVSSHGTLGNDIPVAVYGGAVDNAPVFNGSHTHTADAHFGALTAANVPWTIIPLVSNTSGSLVSVLQEIINRPGFVANNYAGFLLRPTESHSWSIHMWDYFVGSNYASLTYTYTAGGGLSIPVAMASYRQRWR